MGIRCRHLSKARCGRRQPERRSKSASQSPAPGAFPLGRLIINPRLADIFLLFSAAKGAYSSHDNCNQAFSPVRLVDPLRRRRALARLLRIDVCWSERKRSCCAGQTAVGPKEGKESVLRDELSVRHSDALRSARRDSDHRQPDAYLRARTDETIIFRPDEFGGMRRALPSAEA
jgi:hypothetical protein